MAWLANKGRWKSVLVIGALLGLLIAVVQANPAVRARYSSILVSSSGLKVGQFPNAALEQYALTKVNSNGGSCRVFVNNVVSAVSHGGINIAYDEGNYFQAFVDNHATQVTSVSQLVPGDIVQQGQTDSARNLHTFIIVSRVSISGTTGTFVVVDSNHDYNNIVHEYTRSGVTIDNASIRAYRLGYVASAAPTHTTPPKAPTVTSGSGNQASGSGSSPHIQGGPTAPTQGSSPNVQGGSPNLQGSSPNLQGSSPNLQGGGSSPQGGGSSPQGGGSSPQGGSGSPSAPSTPAPAQAGTAPAAPASTSPPATATEPQPPPGPTTYPETAGGVAHTWTNYVNAGGTQGPSIGGGQTVQISCRITGFRVADGDTTWYRIAQAPWNNEYYVSADAFYNNGRTSGSLQGTPFYDPAVPVC